MLSWMFNDLGLEKVKVRELEVHNNELAHYSKRTIDFEYTFPFGLEELYGLAYRTDFDLKNHYREEPYLDAETNEKLYPHVIEPTFGVDRSVLAVLCDAYKEEEDRIVLKLNPKVAPYKVAVFPLLKNKPELVAKAREVFKNLKMTGLNIAWDERGNIGKRYFSQDEIGTPYCVTVDFETLGESDSDKKDTVTIRDSDTMTQERIAISDLKAYIQKSLE